MAVKIIHGSAGLCSFSFLSLITDTALFSAYLLASAALSTFYGKISDLIGRKAVLFPVIILFLVCSFGYMSTEMSRKANTLYIRLVLRCAGQRKI